MSRHRRLAAALIGVGWLGVLGAGAPAHADTADDQFAAMVEHLGIDIDPEKLPATGRGICTMLSSGVDGNANPVPAIRGVRDTLQSRGLERPQAGALMQAAVLSYCPQYGPLVGR